MSAMKNLSLCLDELYEAECRALKAGKWISIGDSWKSPHSGETYPHDKAIQRLKGRWSKLGVS